MSLTKNSSNSFKTFKQQVISGPQHVRLTNFNQYKASNTTLVRSPNSQLAETIQLNEQSQKKNHNQTILKIFSKYVKTFKYSQQYNIIIEYQQDLMSNKELQKLIEDVQGSEKSPKFTSQMLLRGQKQAQMFMDIAKFVSQNAGHHIISQNQFESLKFLFNHIKEKAKAIYNVMISTDVQHSRVGSQQNLNTGIAYTNTQGSSNQIYGQSLEQSQFTSMTPIKFEGNQSAKNTTQQTPNIPMSHHKTDHYFIQQKIYKIDDDVKENQNPIRLPKVATKTQDEQAFINLNDRRLTLQSTLKNNTALINDFNRSPEIFNPKQMSMTDNRDHPNNFSNNKFEDNINMALKVLKSPPQNSNKSTINKGSYHLNQNITNESSDGILFNPLITFNKQQPTQIQSFGTFFKKNNSICQKGYHQQVKSMVSSSHAESCDKVVQNQEFRSIETYQLGIHPDDSLLYQTNKQDYNDLFVSRLLNGGEQFTERTSLKKVDLSKQELTEFMKLEHECHDEQRLREVHNHIYPSMFKLNDQALMSSQGRDSKSSQAFADQQPQQYQRLQPKNLPPVTKLVNHKQIANDQQFFVPESGPCTPVLSNKSNVNFFEGLRMKTLSQKTQEVSQEDNKYYSKSAKNSNKKTQFQQNQRYLNTFVKPMKPVEKRKSEIIMSEKEDRPCQIVRQPMHNRVKSFEKYLTKSDNTRPVKKEEPIDGHQFKIRETSVLSIKSESLSILSLQQQQKLNQIKQVFDKFRRQNSEITLKKPKFKTQIKNLSVYCNKLQGKLVQKEIFAQMRLSIMEKQLNIQRGLIYLLQTKVVDQIKANEKQSKAEAIYQLKLNSEHVKEFENCYFSRPSIFQADTNLLIPLMPLSRAFNTKKFSVVLNNSQSKEYGFV
ncbi:UNKNOWN [Stylonychia lemnae]|uniref:Uncharacterized protein n=1 Tax=Stylonychia lemnae TaxID=5949 RepID=A0A078AZF7_STYLE|nr:UNKNOWN [Stylonychia lemnae]|eukprot:CDW86587.1 UNKNOWN [Stylonychia lemnae]